MDDSHQKHKNDKISLIREMEIDDIPNVFHLGEQLFTARVVPNLYRTWDEYEVVSLFQTDGENCLVAEQEGCIVGFALGTTIDKKRSPWKYGYLLWFGIDPKNQGEGIGSRLFRHFHQLMVEQGARILLVDTEADNEPALRFFEKLGFNNQQEHIFLSMNIDEQRRRYEDRRNHKEKRRDRVGGEGKANDNGKRGPQDST